LRLLRFEVVSGAGLVRCASRSWAQRTPTISKRRASGERRACRRCSLRQSEVPKSTGVAGQPTMTVPRYFQRMFVSRKAAARRPILMVLDVPCQSNGASDYRPLGRAIVRFCATSSPAGTQAPHRAADSRSKLLNDWTALGSQCGASRSARGQGSRVDTNGPKLGCISGRYAVA
jgi:hypothetical protein